MTMEMVKDMPTDKQNEIRAEVTEAYRFFGYDGQRLEKAVARAMDSELVEVTNLLGAYNYMLHSEQMTADIICGATADAAIQRNFID